MSAFRQTTLWRASALVVWTLLTIAGMLVVVEGLSSALVFTHDVLRSTPLKELAETRHTRYDSALGWSNVPGTSLPDMYGPGVSLRINAQGFRADHDVLPNVPEGRLRVICSGDSFTFGYGVSDEHTWCRLLEEADPRLETVNMGQGGYGIDQAFLWYERDAEPLQHQLQLFAFITIDFLRMQSAEFQGYPKPTLAFEGGALVVHNSPVPRRPPYAAWIARYRPAIRALRLNALAALIRAWLGGAPDPEAAAVNPDQATWAVASAVFERLQVLNRSRRSRLVLVYLPIQRDYTSPSADPWRRRLTDLSARSDITFVDLVEALRALPASEIDALFIQPGALDYAGAAGHYTVAGNRWVARTVYERLAAPGGPLARSKP